MATVDTITAYLNLEIPNRPAATGGAFTAGRMLRATGVGKFVEQRTPDEVLADIGAVNKDGTTAFTGTGDGFSDDETLASNSAVSTVSERALLSFIEGLVGVSVDYFFNDTASDIGGIYYNMTDAGLGGGESTLSVAGLGAGDDQPLVNFATLSGFPGIGSLRSGIYVVHTHAERTGGTRSLVLYAKIYKRTTGGTETLIVTTHVSAEITSEVEVTLHANLTANVDIDPTDRIVVKWFANIGSSGSVVTVALRQEGATAAHLDLPTTSDILNQVFVRRDGTKELSADWDAGDHKITAEQLESDVASGAPPLVVASTDVVDNLNADLLDGNHAAAFAASGHAHDIDDLSDVVIDTPSVGHILFFDSADWINAFPSAIGLASTNQARITKAAGIPTPVEGEEYVIFFAHSAATIIEVTGNTTGASTSVVVQLKKRLYSSVSGTNILDTDPTVYTPDTDGEKHTDFVSSAIAANSFVTIVLGTVTGSPSLLSLAITFDIDS